MIARRGGEACWAGGSGGLQRRKPDPETRIGSEGGNPLRRWRARRPISTPCAPPWSTRRVSATASGSAISSRCLYFAIAAGAVTHRDLLLESPVKLPFLNVELPLKAFFILGPLVFLVVHAYVLLHFLLLAGKVGAFHAELQKQVPEDEKRAQLRRQLPSNIFVQFLAGPREVRNGIVGFLLKSVAWISLVAGPIALLDPIPATIPALPQCLDHLVAAHCRSPRPRSAVAAVATDRTRRNHASPVAQLRANQRGRLVRWRAFCQC